MSVLSWICRGLRSPVTFQCFASGGGLVRVKEDEEVLIRPPPETPPWTNCATRVLKTISTFDLAWLCSYFDFYVVLLVMYIYFCQTLALSWGGERFTLTTLGLFRPITGSASHIALFWVINSKSGSRFGGWK
ncbi:unnamed protein product [Cuscuta europaea]|uniref:Uncharacterized protein n=1 Tax=Cuscuta europaea TaxID=41803 RepID=A0A9P0ZFK6_CUSEU|nr:unnamed protein product [Cuscuta europaea]